jgi:hypothetical protein
MRAQKYFTRRDATCRRVIPISPRGIEYPRSEQLNVSLPIYIFMTFELVILVPLLTAAGNFGHDRITIMSLVRECSLFLSLTLFVIIILLFTIVTKSHRDSKIFVNASCQKRKLFLALVEQNNTDNAVRWNSSPIKLPPMLSPCT